LTAEFKSQQKLKILLNFYDIAPEQILAMKAGARTVKARFTGEVQEFSYFFVCARAVSTVFFPTLTDTATFHLGCIDAGTSSAARDGKG
jgi:hypothetical protein